MFGIIASLILTVFSQLSVQTRVELGILNSVALCSQRHGASLSISPYNSFHQFLKCVRKTCHKVELFTGQLCNGKTHFTSQCGRIQVGDFEVGHTSTYLPNLSCDWTITGSEGYIFNITFDHFEMEYSRSECIYDYLAIYDDHDDNFLIDKLCGKIPLPISMYSKSNQVSFRLRTDSYVNSRGFSLFYQELPVNEGLTYFRQYLLLKIKNGTLSSTDSESISMIHERVLVHKWLVRSRIGFFMKLDWNISFHGVNNESSTAVLQIFDGPQPILSAELLYMETNKSVNSKVLDSGVLLSDTFQVFVIFKHGGKGQLNIYIESYPIPACNLKNDGETEISTELNNTIINQWRKQHALTFICPDAHISYTHLLIVFYIFPISDYTLTYSNVYSPFYHVYEIGTNQEWVLLVQKSTYYEMSTLLSSGPNTNDCGYGGILVRQGSNDVFGPFCSKGFISKGYLYKRCKPDSSTLTSVVIYSYSGFVLRNLKIVIYMQEKAFHTDVDDTFCPKLNLYLDSVYHNNNRSLLDNKRSFYDDLNWHIRKSPAQVYLAVNITSITFGQDTNDFVSISGSYSTPVTGKIEVTSVASLNVYTYVIINRIDCLGNNSFELIDDNSVNKESPSEIIDGWGLVTIKHVNNKFSFTFRIHCTSVYFEFGIWMTKSLSNLVERTLPVFLSRRYNEAVNLETDVNLSKLGATWVRNCYYTPAMALFRFGRPYYVLTFGTLKSEYYRYIRITIDPADNELICRAVQLPDIEMHIKIYEYYGCSEVPIKSHCLISLISRNSEKDSGLSFEWKTTSSELVETYVMAGKASDLWKKHRGFQITFNYKEYESNTIIQSNACKSNSVYFEGNCYSTHVSAHSLSWNSANIHCKTNGAHLLSIKTQSELQFIKHMLLTLNITEHITTGIWFLGLQSTKSVSLLL